jgi:hypothetical protein
MIDPTHSFSAFDRSYRLVGYVVIIAKWLHRGRIKQPLVDSMKGHILTVALVGMLPSVALAPQTAEQPDTIEKAVKLCVDLVHATKAEELDRQFFKGFDAYYNPADGTVQNNAYRNGDRLPLYTFNKCMVQKGFPLTNKKAD